MRLMIRIGVVPDGMAPIDTVHAQVADASEEAAAIRSIGASIDLKTLLAAAGLLITLMVQHVNTQTTITQLQGQIDTERTARSLAQRRTDVQINAIESRFNSEVVSRQEYQNNVGHNGDRFNLLQSEIQQLYSVQLGHSGR